MVKRNLVKYQKSQNIIKVTVGSKESVGLKFKKSICTELCLKFWFESDWYFSNITKSGWFWKWLSRRKVLNNHFLKSLQKQPYADVLKNRCPYNFSNIYMKAPVFQAFQKNTSGDICRSFLLNHKQYGIVSTKKGLQIWSEYFIYTLLVQSIWTRFYWLTCRKQKLVQSKPLRLWQWRQGFCPLLLNVYFNDMQINAWLYLSCSL